MKSPAFSFYVRDWLLGDTVRALHRQGGRGVGVYTFLLCEAWLQNPVGTLPTDLDLLAELARVPRPEFDKYWALIKRQFPSNGNGRLFNERLILSYDIQQARSRAGFRGGKKRKQS